jgi:ABC-type glycerol-3-phosphate transport system substrate-binding protein
MARWVQTALRKDPLVQAAVASASGKALMVWDGDWIQGEGEDGKGLAAVREAIMWEVAFAPKDCRSQPVHGLVLISLNTGPGAPRLALGAGEWRWSDLVAIR